MTTAVDPQTVRKVSRKLLAAHISHYAFFVGDRVLEAVGDPELWHTDRDAYIAWCDAVVADIRTAVLSWPDEQPQEFECEVCTKPITAYPCMLCEHEPDPWKKPDEQPQDEWDGDSAAKAGRRFADAWAQYDNRRGEAGISRDATFLVSGNSGATARLTEPELRSILDTREQWRNLALSRGRERDGDVRAVADTVSILEGMLDNDAWAYDAGRARNVLLDYFARELDALKAREAKAV